MGFGLKREKLRFSPVENRQYFPLQLPIMREKGQALSIRAERKVAYSLASSRIVRWQQRWLPIVHTPFVQGIVQTAAALLGGFYFSRTLLFGRFAPLGTAVVAAVPYGKLWAAVLGAMAGYLFPSSIEVPVRYLAAMLACAAIRWALNEWDHVKDHPLFAPAIAFLPMIATGGVVLFSGGSAGNTAALYLAESLFGGGGAYFFSRFCELLRQRDGSRVFSSADLCTVTIVMGLSLSAVAGIDWWGIHPARLVAVLFILYAAQCGGAGAGAVCGIGIGAVFSLALISGSSYLAGACALGGLMAGIFAPMGRLASAAAFGISAAILVMQSGVLQPDTSFLMEAAIASLIFLLVPPGAAFSSLFTARENVQLHDGLRRNVMQRLDYAAAALENVSSSTDLVAQKLESYCAASLQDVLQKAADACCKSCGMREFCWRHHKPEVSLCMQQLLTPLQMGQPLKKEETGEFLQKHCSRLPELLRQLTTCHEEYQLRQTAHLRAMEVRQVMNDQFHAMSGMLRDMAGELEMYEQYDFGTAQKIREVMRRAGMLPIEVSCRVDRFSRMTVEIEAHRRSSARLSKGSLLRELSQAAGRVFASPCVTLNGDTCRLQLSERPVYDLQKGTACHCCGSSVLSGDSCGTFPDGQGREIAVISDGMGTGARAAVDGAMAAGVLETLVKAGVGFRCAMQIVNSTLLCKSEEETLATLDIAVIDRFDGSVEWIKAGAPASFTCHNGRAKEITLSSLPLGILSQVQAERCSSDLSEGDVLLLVSDGATAAGTQWICELLEKEQKNTAQQLADAVLRGAMEKRCDGHDDDITVLCLKLEKRRVRPEGFRSQDQWEK